MVWYIHPDVVWREEQEGQGTLDPNMFSIVPGTAASVQS